MSTTTAASPARTRPRPWRRFLPPQHGAWAMLVVPYLAGLLVAGWRWPHAPLLVAWLAGYLLSYYALQAVKSRRPGRFRDQLLWYGALTVPALALVLVAAPRVLWFAPVYAALAAVNVWYARQRDERALLNDLASVTQSCLMVLVVAAIAEGESELALRAFGIVLLYFAGTVLYVKTMIRERGSVGYRRASVAYHLVAVPVAALVGPAAAVLFAALALRAWLLPTRALRPKQVGVIEIVFSALLLITVAVI